MWRMISSRSARYQKRPALDWPHLPARSRAPFPYRADRWYTAAPSLICARRQARPSPKDSSSAVQWHNRPSAPACRRSQDRPASVSADAWKATYTRCATRLKTDRHRAPFDERAYAECAIARDRPRPSGIELRDRQAHPQIKCYGGSRQLIFPLRKTRKWIWPPVSHFCSICKWSERQRTFCMLSRRNKQSDRKKHLQGRIVL